jgi:hypothetical protein
MGHVLAPASLNRYLYANGDPINQFDPNGTDILGYFGAARLGMAVAGAALFAVGTQLLAKRYTETVGFPEQPFPKIDLPTGCDGLYELMAGACKAMKSNPISYGYCMAKATAFYIACKLGKYVSGHPG